MWSMNSGPSPLPFSPKNVRNYALTGDILWSVNPSKKVISWQNESVLDFFVQTWIV